MVLLANVTLQIPPESGHKRRLPLMMLKLNVSDFTSSSYKERYAIAEVRNFIDSQACCRGKIFLLNGLRRTGKTVLMEQVLSSYHDKVGCAFYVAQKKDTMADVEAMLLKERDNGTKIVCIDEITRISDFITESSSLPDIFAKSGMSVIVTGTDSLSLSLAEEDSMFDRTKKSVFTHIPFAEHAFVLGTKNIDDYIRFGGLMSPGKSEEGVYDVTSAKRYLNSFVAGNIMHSLANNYRDSDLESLSYDDLCTITNKLVEKYSGHFSTRDFNRELKDVIVTSPLSPLPDEEVIPIEKSLKIVGQKKEIAKDFAQIINADGTLGCNVTPKMVEEYTEYLKKMGVVSVIDQYKFNFNGRRWERELDEELYHIVQPAIRYYHLQEAKGYITKNEKVSHLLPSERRAFAERLNNMIMGTMSEQIVLFDTASCLRADRHAVAKVTFSVTDAGSNKNDAGEYDMLIHDKEKDEYWIFEIKHSSKSNPNQLKNLTNKNFRTIMDDEFGTCKGFVVLYNGEPKQNDDGTVYFNMCDFLISLDKSRDPDVTHNALIEQLSSQDKNHIENTAQIVRSSSRRDRYLGH